MSKCVCGKELGLGDKVMIRCKDCEQQISDLEAKLKALQNGIIDDETLNMLVKEHKLYKDLEAKLAEKKKENEQLKKFDDLNKTFFDLFRTAFKKPYKVDDLFNTLKTMQEKQVQEKIPFAIEQLEQVKETTECVLDNALKNSSLNQSYYDRLLDEIDNQIKQLKEGK